MFSPTNKQKVKNWLRANKIIIIVFLIYATISFLAVIFHENWEDEAQAWLTARDCSFFELISRMKYEGHFLPWYLIIMPFAKLGLPFKTVNIISWAISSISAWLYLKFLPCKLPKKILLIFTLPMLYLYPVISRCYCLFPLSIILSIIFYKDRFKKPLRYLLSIVLAATTHIYLFAFAFVVAIKFLIDFIKIKKNLSKKQSKKVFCSIIVAAIIVLVLYLPLLGSIGGASNINLTLNGLDFPSISNNIIRFYEIIAEPISIIFAHILVIIILSYLVIYRQEILTPILICTLWQFFISNFIFQRHQPQRVFLLLFSFIFFIFCSNKSRRNKKAHHLSSISVIKLALLAAASVFLSVKTGHILYSISSFYFCILLLCIMFARIFKTKLEIKNILKKSALLSSSLLMIFCVINGVTYVYDEIKYTFSDSYNTAQYIKQKLLLDKSPDETIFLVDVGSLLYTSVIAYIEDPGFSLYDISVKDSFTYAKSPAATEDFKLPHIEKRDVATPCDTKTYCYYITVYNYTSDQSPKLYSYESPEVRKWASDGSFSLIYDSGETEDDWTLAQYEHFKIYEISKTYFTEVTKE